MASHIGISAEDSGILSSLKSSQGALHVAIQSGGGTGGGGSDPVPTSTNAVRVAVGVSSATLIAARADRRMLTISNPRSNTATIAFGTGTATLAGNPNLEPGDSWSGETTAGFNAIGTAACSVDVTETYA